MTKEPTQEQKQEFWEWCGFTDVHYNRLGAILEKWCGFLNGKWMFLPIDLNNLFKYAVPKLKGTYIKAMLLIDWIMRIVYHKADPANSLFWALWQVKENSND